MESIENYCNSLATVTYFVNKSITPQVIQLDKTGKLKDEPLRFFYTILLKLNNGLDTSVFLLANFYDKPHFVDSLIVLIRSLVSDSAIFWYLIERSENDKEKLVANIKALYFDHIAYTINAVEKDFEAIYGDTQQDVQDKVNQIKRDRYEYFDSAGQANVKPLHASVRFALRYIACNTTSTTTKKLVQLFYHHYDIYSKYEHLGDLTFALIHRQYRDETKHKLAWSVVESINCLILPMIAAVIRAFPDISSESVNKFEELFLELKTQYPLNR